MNNSGVYAGEPEIISVVNFYKRNVIIIRTNGIHIYKQNFDTEYIDNTELNFDLKKVNIKESMILFYNGINHYDLITKNF